MCSNIKIYKFGIIYNMQSYDLDRNPKRFTGNDKLYNRNFFGSNNTRPPENGNDVERLTLEREFGKSSFDERSDNISMNSNKSNGVGEITGNQLDKDRIDRGMPMRSQYTTKKELYDGNKYLDFNLHDKVPKSKSKIGYNESNNYSAFAEIGASTSSLTSQINPIFIVSNSIEKFGSNVYECLIDTLPNSGFIVNTIGLYTLFSGLYLGSNHNTQNELEKFFNYPQKGILHKSLSKIVHDVNSIINIKNLMIVSKNIPHNIEFRKHISEFCVYAPVNINDRVRESQKLNYIIDNMMNTKMKNSIKPGHLENLQVMFMTVGVIHPRWYYSFDRVAPGMFFGYDMNKKMNFLQSLGKSYNYYEDNEHQLIELRCGNNGGLFFGILLHKDVFVPETNEKLQFYISHAKTTILDDVRIPMFTQDSKLRYNNTLKNLGLSSVFLQITADELFPKRVQLHDIIQNMKIIIDGTSYKNDPPQSKGVSSMRKFVADRPFMYYLRLGSTNTIIMNGMYQ
jgi:serine protease inhibitor